MTGTSIINRIENERIRRWYEKNWDAVILNSLIEDYEKDGFSFDSESGLLFRGFSDKTIRNIGRTIIDIVFPRPVDLHYHKDVDEAIYIVKGNGLIIKSIGPQHIRYSEEEISEGKEFYIPRGAEHSFRPDKGYALEIKLACSGILNPSEEICVSHFDEFDPWVKYYKR